jgi:hypothetical protein
MRRAAVTDDEDDLEEILEEISPDEFQAADAVHVPPQKSKPRLLDVMAARGFQLWLKHARPEEILCAIDEMTEGKLSSDELEAGIQRLLLQTKRGNTSAAGG